MTAKNIITNIIKPRFTIVILRKIVYRFNGLFEKKKLNKQWYEKKSHPIEFCHVKLNKDIYKEAVSFNRDLKIKASKVLSALPVKLGGAGFCTLLYYIVRIIKPEVVVETGVAAGFSSQTILTALRINGGGKLYSSDFPYFRIQNPEKYIGVLVDHDLRKDWVLLLDGDQKNLSSIQDKLGNSRIGIFHYDSDKSYYGRREALRILNEQFDQDTLLIFDDISDNNQFRDWVTENNFEFRVFAHENKFIGLTCKNKEIIDRIFPISV